MTIYQVTARGNFIDDDQWRNVYHYEDVGPIPNFAEFDDIVTDFGTHMSGVHNAWADVADTAAEYTGIDVWYRDIVGQSWVFMGTTDTSILGTSGGGSLLPEVVAARVYLAALGLPRGGRKHVAGLSTNAQNNTALTALAVTELLGYAAAVVTTINGPASGRTFVPSVYSRATQVASPMTGEVAVPTKLSSMRSRGPSYGI